MLSRIAIDWNIGNNWCSITNFLCWYAMLIVEKEMGVRVRYDVLHLDMIK